jgi:ADP-ribose pyrophosphatase YjhB (NUDIX family)
MRPINSLFWLWRTLRLPDWLRWKIMSTANQQFLVGVAVIVFNDQNEVLLFQHTYRSPYAWGLPTGWLKRGEDPSQAISREVYEESKLVVKVTGLHSVSASRRVPRLDIVYLGCPVEGSFQPSSEVSAAEYFMPDSLPPMLADQCALIRQALEQIRQNGR